MPTSKSKVLREKNTFSLIHTYLNTKYVLVVNKNICLIQLSIKVLHQMAKHFGWILVLWKRILQWVRIRQPTISRLYGSIISSRGCTHVRREQWRNSIFIDPYSGQRDGFFPSSGFPPFSPKNKFSTRLYQDSFLGWSQVKSCSIFLIKRSQASYAFPAHPTQ
jgi:hypothetical protein